VYWEHVEWNCLYTEKMLYIHTVCWDMQNGTTRFCKYAQCYKSPNRFALFVFKKKHVERNLIYTENMRNKTVHNSRTCKSTLNLNVLVNSKLKSKSIRWLIRRSDGSFWLSQSKPKNLMQVYLEMYIIAFNFNQNPH
jgi:hypothetical protein